jgi:hypothetical protein
MEVSGQLDAPARFTLREGVPLTHWIGGWVGLSAGLDVVLKRKIRSPRRESNPNHPIVQPLATLYRLSYPSSSHTKRGTLYIEGV